MIENENIQWSVQIQLRAKSGDGCNWVADQVCSSGSAVEVFDLRVANQFVLVIWQTAEEHGAADAEDGGAPAKPVGPGVVILALDDQVIELDGVNDQSYDLDNHCGERHIANLFFSHHRVNPPLNLLLLCASHSVKTVPITWFSKYFQLVTGRFMPTIIIFIF